MLKLFPRFFGRRVMPSQHLVAFGSQKQGYTLPDKTGSNSVQNKPNSVIQGAIWNLVRRKIPRRKQSHLASGILLGEECNTHGLSSVQQTLSVLRQITTAANDHGTGRQLKYLGCSRYPAPLFSMTICASQISLMVFVN